MASLLEALGADSFPHLFRLLPSLASGLFILKASSIASLNLDLSFSLTSSLSPTTHSLALLPLFYKDSCDCIGSSQIIQENLCISRSLI